jgi:hypothetical protein
MNLNQAIDVMYRTHTSALSLNMRANAIELKSGPGVGKSSSIRQLCKRLAASLNQPVGLVTEMLATIEAVDMRGFMIPQKAEGRPITVFSLPPWMPSGLNVTVFYPDGRELEPPFVSGTEVPAIGVLFLDEWGQGSDEVKKAAAELVLNGRVGNDRLPTGWRVICASNRMTDRAGVVRELTFIINRRMELHIDAHLPTWNDWVNGLAPNLRPHHLTVSFANRQPDLVFRDAVPPGTDPFCTPRSLIMMDRDLQALRSDDDIAHDRLPMDMVAREVCKGWIGGGESAQFFTHIRFADMLPELSEIERDPMTAKLPDARDAQMVCSFMLAHNVTKKNAQNILKYVQRLKIDMQVLAMRTIRDSQDRAECVANTREFGNWLLEHKELLLAAHG